MFEVVITEKHSRGEIVNIVVPCDDDSVISYVNETIDNENECVRIGILKAYTILAIADPFIDVKGYVPPAPLEISNGT